MPETKLHQLSQLGQSVWLDYINRHMIDSGQLKQWIDNGLRGMTSNPSIFHQVISKGTDYDAKIARLRQDGKSDFEIYDEVTVADIQDAADAFLPVYKKTSGLDGYVSLEINPQLANDTDKSITEGRRLFEKVARPNVMIKVPATPAGYPVIEELLTRGINVNVTLIFSLDQYNETVHAFWRGLNRLAEDGGDLSKVRSVASVFVSRIDTEVDRQIDEKSAAAALKGKAAVANSRLIYARYEELFASDAFKRLKEQGAAPQRVLWGSTSTKNPEYNDVKYVEELIAPDTVNTIPEKTLKAFLDHGRAELGLKVSSEEAAETIESLMSFGIDVDQVCSELLTAGVDAFVSAFEELLASVETKARQLSSAR